MPLIKISRQQYPDLCRAFKSGKTQIELAKSFGISQERVRQILEECGLSGKDGGVRKRVESRKKKQETKFLQKYGCTREQFDSIKGHYTEKTKSPWCAFKAQRRNAISRGLEWDFVFWEWWSIWDESGKWELRGRGVGRYCMCRIGDEGPYAKDNVYIGSVIHNSSLGRTLAFERGVNETLVYRLIKRAGGPAEVSRLIGIKANYLSQLSVRNIIPKRWFEDGKAQKLITNSGIGLSLSKIFEMTNRV